MACGFAGRNANLAFKKETSWGAYIAPDIKLRASTESLSKTVNYTEDGALVGEAFTTDMIKSSSNSGGGLETKFHPDTAGIILHWALGGESAVANPPNSYLIINYTGASPYARLKLATNNLTAELSADGTTYAADANFGTTGVYDLTAAANDTTAELAALINADTGWACSYVGAAAGVTASIPAFTATELVNNSDKVGAMVLGTAVTSTAAKVHSVFPAATTTCLPSYTIQVNRTLGTNKSLAYVGSKLGQLSLNISAGELTGASLTVSAKNEEVDKNDVTVATPIIQAYSALKTRVFLDNIEVTVAKNFTININNALDESFVIGSEYILEQERQSATIDFSGSVNLTTPATDVYSKRTNYTGDVPSEIIVYMEGVNNADVTNAVPFSVLLRLPRCKFTDFNAPISGPDRIVINMAGQAVKPKATYEHIECKIVDQDVTTY
jgi:hypothetical protein